MEDGDLVRLKEVFPNVSPEVVEKSLKNKSLEDAVKVLMTYSEVCVSEALE